MKEAKQKSKMLRSILAVDGLSGVMSVGAEKMGMWFRRTGTFCHLDNCVFSLDGLPPDICDLLLRGEYEWGERKSVRLFLDRHIPVIELGSCIGVVSCIANCMLKTPSEHVVVEGNPGVISTLRLNAQRNHCQFSIINAALGYDESPFFITRDLIGSGTAARTGAALPVPQVTMKEILAKYAFDCFTLICDIEGTEIDLISHEGKLLADRCPLLIIETHEKLLGTEPIRNMMRSLDELGFVLAKRIRDTSVFTNRSARRRLQ